MRTALLIVDMQNSFLHPDGGNYYPDVAPVIENCASLLDAARTAGTIIVHIADRHRAGVHDFEENVLPRHCVHGEFDAAFFEGFGSNGAPNEIEIVKRRFSAFFATDLALFLNEQTVERVVICGVKANVCVRATAQDAFGHGFEVNVVRDATNSNQTHLAEASLEDIERYMGRLVTTDAVKGFLA